MADTQAQPKENPKDYLGDSVYAEYDGYGIILTTNNGHGPSNTICMEPEVIEALNRFVARVTGRTGG